MAEFLAQNRYAFICIRKLSILIVFAIPHCLAFIFSTYGVPPIVVFSLTSFAPKPIARNITEYTEAQSSLIAEQKEILEELPRRLGTGEGAKPKRRNMSASKPPKP
ncbi:MAG: hypothetical protein QXZ47_01385 [Candidatus Bathyarchaeia archaeon]